MPSNDRTRVALYAIARILGLPNSTFRRRYPDIAQEIADRRTAPIVKAARQTEEVRLAARNAKLKRENHQLNSSSNWPWRRFNV
ncbi:hypothetical protein [Rhodococcus koreensis]